MVLSLKENGLGTREAGQVLGEMLKANSVLKELDLSSNYVNPDGGGDAPGFAQELAVGIKDNGVMMSLDISNNNLGQLVLPEGWRVQAQDGKNAYFGPNGEASWDAPTSSKARGDYRCCHCHPQYEGVDEP